MLEVEAGYHRIHMGRHFSVEFQRTLRIPDDGGQYPLPPGLGPFPVLQVADYADRVPESWRAHGGVFIPMYQREALWLSFSGAHWRPNAVKIAVGRVNAVNGKRLHRRLNRTRQNYLVDPDQPWLDGINAGAGFIRQFVAMPLGMGYTVEGQVTGKEEYGGLQVRVYDPKPGRFPDEEPAPQYDERSSFSMGMVAESDGMEMGLGAGGRMRQALYPDRYGADTWDLESYGEVCVHIANSMMYREITGQEPPPTPVSARTYTEYGMPWFDLYDEDEGDVAPSRTLAKVKSVKQMDKKKGIGGQQDDSAAEVGEGQVWKLK